MTDRKLFDLLAARVLKLAEDSFRTPIASMKPINILKLEELEPTSLNLELCHQTIRWLKDEGYLRCQDPVFATQDNQHVMVFHDVILTNKGFNALNATIDFAGKKERAAEVLGKALKGAGREMRSAFLAEIIKQIFAAGTTLL
jgi:hypothetical protein